jgi:hypothetical protein
LGDEGARAAGEASAIGWNHSSARTGG